MNQLIIASGNKAKLKEYMTYCASFSKPIPISQVLGFVPEVEETEDSTAGNAKLKALDGANKTDRLCLADDTAMCIDGLGGFPGVHFKRFAIAAVELSGGTFSDAVFERLILDMMALRTGPGQRTGYLETSIAIARPGADVASVVSRRSYFELATKPKGEHNGLLGARIIIPRDGDGRSIAQYPIAEKIKVSSRGSALRTLLSNMQDFQALLS